MSQYARLNSEIDNSTIDNSCGMEHCGMNHDDHHPIEVEDELLAKEMQESEPFANISAIDKLKTLVGLDDVKSRFFDIKAKVDIAKPQNRRLDDEQFSAVFMGNPGTGKPHSFSPASAIYQADSLKGKRRYLICTIGT